jgi:hypothetical protein
MSINLDFIWQGTTVFSEDSQVNTVILKQVSGKTQGTFYATLNPEKIKLYGPSLCFLKDRINNQFLGSKQDVGYMNTANLIVVIKKVNADILHPVQIKSLPDFKPDKSYEVTIFLKDGKFFAKTVEKVQDVVGHKMAEVQADQKQIGSLQESSAAKALQDKYKLKCLYLKLLTDEIHALAVEASTKGIALNAS